MRQKGINGIVNFSNRSIGVGVYRYLGGRRNPYTNGGLESLKDFRLEGKIADLKKLRNLFLLDRHNSNSIFYIKSSTPLDIFKGTVLNEISLQRELIWSKGFILANLIKIKHYINLKQKNI